MGFADDVVAVRRDLSRLALDHQSRTAGAPRDDLLRRALSVEKEARRLRSRELVAVTLLHRAELLLAIDRGPDAVSVLEQAKKDLGELRKDDLRVRVLGHLAEAHGRLGDWPAVTEVCGEGIALVEKYRYKVSADYLASAYLRSRIGLYAWGVRSAYELKCHGLAIERAELSKCRPILSTRLRRDRGSSREDAAREKEFRELCRQIAEYPVGNAPEALLARRTVLWDWMNIGSSAEPPTTFRLDDVQRLIRPDEAILFYYWVSPTSLLIATVERSRFAVELRCVTPEQRSTLETYAKHALESTEINYSAFEPARAFGSFLLPASEPVAWHEKQRLLISPHRVLHSIPFHAMKYRDRWLIERAAISYIANLSSLRLPSAPPKEPRVLVVGVEHFDVPGKPLPSLPDAELEAHEVRQIYGAHGVPATLLLGPQATADRLRELEAGGTLGEYSCLHFATHGENVNTDSPMESRFYLQDSLLDGLELANLRLGASTVVLSACCSGHRPIGGRGLNELPGDDLFGLQAAFFRAGANYVLGTLWPVDSLAARQIVGGFHAGLAANGMRDHEGAMQASLCDYLSKAGLRSRKLFFWAPFFLSVLGREKRR